MNSFTLHTSQNFPAHSAGSGEFMMPVFFMSMR